MEECNEVSEMTHNFGQRGPIHVRRYFEAHTVNPELTWMAWDLDWGKLKRKMPNVMTYTKTNNYS